MFKIGTSIRINRIKGKVKLKKVIKGCDMSERFELSFKNKEVRMWFYLAVPAFIIGSILIFYGGQNYPYIPLSVLVITWTIFYI